MLVTKYLLQAGSLNELHCQYWGSADHQFSTCLQEEACPTCKTKNHSLKYICPMLKEVEKQEGNDKFYRDDDHPEQVYQVNEGPSNVEVTLMVKFPRPIVGQIDKIYVQILKLHEVEICVEHSKGLQGLMMFLKSLFER